MIPQQPVPSINDEIQQRIDTLASQISFNTDCARKDQQSADMHRKTAQDLTMLREQWIAARDKLG